MQVHFRSHELTQSMETIISFLKFHPILDYILFSLLVLGVGGLLWMHFKKSKKNTNDDDTFTHKDFERIAGEDVFATQLDLARAYIEMSQAELAKAVLKQVIKQANGKSKQDAKQLMMNL